MAHCGPLIRHDGSAVRDRGVVYTVRSPAGPDEHEITKGHAMTPLQLDFWRALCAPFPDNELSTVSGRGGKTLTYIDKRALENRLDDVCGPFGWSPKYEATARGYKCELSILCPMGNGAWVWHAKEDGAGFEEMGSKNRDTGEWEADVDNDEKSGYTNALRRAAQDAWGIGRSLYKKGVPALLMAGDPSTA